MKNQTKSIKFEIKAEKEDDKFMVFTGIGSPFNGKADQGGDIVEEGAFKQTLEQQTSMRVLLWHHNTHEPIGTVKLEETKDGLMITEGKINKTIQRGREVAELIGMGALKGLSIGYRSIKESFKDGKRLLKEIKLFEMSIVPFPMDEDAMITSAKAETMQLGFEDVLSILNSKIDEAKESSFDLINETVKKLNKVLMKSFDESTNSLLESSLNDQENEEDENSNESDHSNQKDKEDIEAEEIKDDLLKFFKGLNNV